MSSKPTAARARTASEQHSLKLWQESDSASGIQRAEGKGSIGSLTFALGQRGLCRNQNVRSERGVLLEVVAEFFQGMVIAEQQFRDSSLQQSSVRQGRNKVQRARTGDNRSSGTSRYTMTRALAAFTAACNISRCSASSAAAARAEAAVSASAWFEGDVFTTSSVYTVWFIAICKCTTVSSEGRNQS